MACGVVAVKNTNKFVIKLRYLNIFLKGSNDDLLNIYNLQIKHLISEFIPIILLSKQNIYFKTTLWPMISTILTKMMYNL